MNEQIEALVRAFSKEELADMYLNAAIWATRIEHELAVIGETAEDPFDAFSILNSYTETVTRLDFIESLRPLHEELKRLEKEYPGIRYSLNLLERVLTT